MLWILRTLRPGKGEYSFTRCTIYPWSWRSEIKNIKIWEDISLDSGQNLTIWGLSNLAKYTKPQKHQAGDLNRVFKVNFPCPGVKRGWGSASPPIKNHLRDAPSSLQQGLCSTQHGNLGCHSLRSLTRGDGGCQRNPRRFQAGHVPCQLAVGHWKGL